MLTGLFQEHIQRVSMQTLRKISHLKAVKHGTRSPLKTSEEFTRPTTNSDGPIKVGLVERWPVGRTTLFRWEQNGLPCVASLPVHLHLIRLRLGEC